MNTHFISFLFRFEEKACATLHEPYYISGS